MFFAIQLLHFSNRLLKFLSWKQKHDSGSSNSQIAEVHSLFESPAAPGTASKYARTFTQWPRLPCASSHWKANITASQSRRASFCQPASASRRSPRPNWHSTNLAAQPLLPAIRFYLENFHEPAVRIALTEALNQFMEAKKASNNRPDTIRSLEYKIGAFIADHAEKGVCDILPDHISAEIHRTGLSPVTKSNIRRALHSFFEWCATRKPQAYCAGNPVKSIEPIKVDREEPQLVLAQLETEIRRRDRWALLGRGHRHQAPGRRILMLGRA